MPLLVVTGFVVIGFVALVVAVALVDGFHKHTHTKAEPERVWLTFALNKLVKGAARGGRLAGRVQANQWGGLQVCSHH